MGENVSSSKGLGTIRIAHGGFSGLMMKKFEVGMTSKKNIRKILELMKKMLQNLASVFTLV